MIDKLDKLLTNLGEYNVLLRLIRFGRRNFDNPIEFIDFLIESVNTNPIIKEKLIEHLNPVFRRLYMQKFITDFRIFSDDKFLPLLFRQLGNKLLPQITNDQTLTSLMNEVLYSKVNHNFVKIIPVDRWEKLYEAIFNGNIIISNREYVKKQIREGAVILMDRIVGGAVDSELFKLSFIRSIDENPFQILTKDIIESLQVENCIDSKKIEELKTKINLCQSYLDNIIELKDQKGISLKITVKVTRLRQQLSRLGTLLNALYLLDTQPLALAMATITRDWLSFYSPKSSVTNSFQSTIYVLTFLITWHNMRAGGKYITSTLKEYMTMFYSALGGGCIVAVLCFIKAQMSMGYHPPFSQAFLYFINYSLGFVVIYLLHFTLATKQPAMTAAALAHTLNQDDKSANDYKEFGLLFSRLFRSQFIAFIGNVLAVFVLAIIIFYFLTMVFGVELLNMRQATGFRDELITMDAKIFWYASITGAFLFLSGLVSGLTENYTKYNNISERLYYHPLLKVIIKEKSRLKLVNWYQDKIGGIMGNVFLGFCLGGAFLIGNFLGIPFDIRHITFSAGTYAMSLCYFDFAIGWEQLLLGFASIFGIGILNFIISFSLSLWVAMKSVNVPTRELGKILYGAFRLFIKKPSSFFIPSK